MAQRKGNFWSGIAGPIIFKIVNNKQIATSRVVPGQKRQTAASVKTAINFGLASKTGRRIRDCYQSQIEGLNDGSMHRRLTTELASIYLDHLDKKSSTYNFDADSFYTLTNFEFNEAARLKNRMVARPDIIFTNRKLTITFPEDDQNQFVKFPVGASKCDMTVAVVYLRIADHHCMARPLAETILIEKTKNNPQGQSFNFNVPDGCLCVMSIFLKFDNKTAAANRKNVNAGAICYSTFTPGNYTGEDKHRWIKR